MDIIWNHKINTVNTNTLIKYFEITAYNNNSITFRYICKNYQEYVEKEEIFNFDINKLEKFKNIIMNFPKIEILELDINQVFVFMNILLKNL